jgi:hypothetical protein
VAYGSPMSARMQFTMSSRHVESSARRAHVQYRTSGRIESNIANTKDAQVSPYFLGENCVGIPPRKNPFGEANPYGNRAFPSTVVANSRHCAARLLSNSLGKTGGIQNTISESLATRFNKMLCRQRCRKRTPSGWR